MRERFVQQAEAGLVPFATLCAKFGISRKTGYKWLNRFRLGGSDGLRPRSRQPKSSPRKTPDAVVSALLELRRAHPEWSGARLRMELARQGVQPLPAPSTIDLILRRQREAAAQQLQTPGADALRFEPNFRWILMLGAEVSLQDGTATVPVVVRDDATGFYVGATLLPSGGEEALRVFVEEQFRRHGLPWRMVIPRDEALREQPPCRAQSPLTVWLMRLGVAVEFAFPRAAREPTIDEAARARLTQRLSALSPYQRGRLGDGSSVPDPLTQFEQQGSPLTLESAAALLEQLREQHNAAGELEGLQRRSPLTLFRPSRRAMPAELPVPVYAPEAEVRLVSEKGIFTFKRRLVHVGRAFSGMNVEVKLTPDADLFVVAFAGQVLGLLDASAAEVDETTSLELAAV